MKTQSMIDQTRDAVVNHADDLLRQGARALSDSSEVVRDRALAASDAAAEYIRREPVTAVLLAALGGAALVGLASLLARGRR
ncbi:MAG TPA: hypothetical protein PKA20_25355 [Burkholderiaceae bacterium]|nr:hypothetical protein [Burkholderiaceae bacterium]